MSYGVVADGYIGIGSSSTCIYRAIPSINGVIRDCVASNGCISHCGDSATIILGDGFEEKIKKRMGALEKLDEDGLIKLEAVHQKNENLLYKVC